MGGGLESRYVCRVCGADVAVRLELTFPDRLFEKYSNVKFHDNLAIGSRAVPCGRTDMTKLIAAFRNFKKAPKNVLLQNNVKLS